MSISVIRNHSKYLARLHKTISENGLILDPKALKSFVKIFYHKGEVTGWEIRGKQVTFASSDYLDCDEFASKDKQGKYNVTEFSYHFNPVDESRLVFRIDLESKDLHLNPAPCLEPKLGHRIPPADLHINIEDFNSLLAIHAAMQYISSGLYPTDDTDGIYNKVLDGIRRLIS